MSLRRPFLWSLSLLLAALPASAIASAPALFVTPVGPAPVLSAAPDPAVIRSIEVRADPAAATAAALTLDLFDRQVVARRTRLVERGPEDFTWVGEIADLAGSSVVVTFRGDHAAGVIHLPAAAYRLESAAPGVQRLYELDDRRFAACGGADVPPEPGATGLPEFEPDGPASTELASTGATSTITVMVVYTQDVAAAVGDVATEIQNAIDVTNLAWVNSTIDAELVLVHFEEVSYTETNNSSAELACVRSTTDSCLDHVHDLRDAHCADLVSFWLEDTDACGRAYLMTTVSTGFAGNGFSVLQRSCATGNFSFPHELGHNMGAHHDRFVTTARGAYDYSHGYSQTTDRWRTILAYANECSALGFSCPRIAHFSNPDVLYGGAATGIADSSDNARTLNNTLPTVALFRGAVPPARGNVAKLTRTAADVVASWPILGEDVVVRGGDRTLVDLAPLTPAIGTGTWTDSGSVPQASDYFYEVAGVVCGEIGPYGSGDP